MYTLESFAFWLSGGPCASFRNSEAVTSSVSIATIYPMVYSLCDGMIRSSKIVG